MLRLVVLEFGLFTWVSFDYIVKFVVLEVRGKFHDEKYSWINGEFLTSDDRLDLFIKLSSSTGDCLRCRFKPILEFGGGD